MIEDTVDTHPAQYSDSIIDTLEALIPEHVPEGHVVHDPFAGAGVKLGKLCDRIGYTYSGVDLEPWKGRDNRVTIGDSTSWRTYPAWHHSIVTSPTYCNGVSDHFEPKDDSRRLTYRNSAGRPLHENNTGRYSGRGSKTGERAYWNLTEAAVACWPDVALVNVKDSIRAGDIYPLVELWHDLLRRHRYAVTSLDVATPGYRNGANRDARADSETILVARRLS